MLDARVENSLPSGPLTADEVARWTEVAAAVRRWLPVRTQDRNDVRQVLDPVTGMHLTLDTTGWSLAVPYGARRSGAASVVERLGQVTAAVEEATGLVGVDPQCERRFLDDGATRAVEVFDRMGAMGDELGIDLIGAPPRRRRWWRRSAEATNGAGS